MKIIKNIKQISSIIIALAFAVNLFYDYILVVPEIFDEHNEQECKIKDKCHLSVYHRFSENKCKHPKHYSNQKTKINKDNFTITKLFFHSQINTKFIILFESRYFKIYKSSVNIRVINCIKNKSPPFV